MTAGRSRKTATTLLGAMASSDPKDTTSVDLPVPDYAAAVGDIGTRTQSAQFLAQVSASVAESAESERAGESGVNLDEEAARLLQFQQAYQASAKMLQVAQQIFDELLNAVR